MAAAPLPLNKRLAGKKFGLVLSAGFFGFYGHVGFLRGLKDAGLKPSAFAGTSAGGLIAAYAAAGASMEFMEDLVLKQDRRSFWDPDPVGALVDGVRGGHAFTGLLKGDRFRKLLDDTLPVTRMEDCETPLVLVATNLTEARPQVFTQGELAPRVHASCAYPGLFRAVRLEGRLYWDGGLVDKAPALALAKSEAGRDLDAILVHYLPSRTRSTMSGPLAYTRGMGAALAAVRKDHLRLQLEQLAASGLPVYVVTSTLPPVSPRTLERGFDALEQGKLAAVRALSRPDEPFEL